MTDNEHPRERGCFFIEKMGLRVRLRGVSPLLIADETSLELEIRNAKCEMVVRRINM